MSTSTSTQKKDVKKPAAGTFDQLRSGGLGALIDSQATASGATSDQILIAKRTVSVMPSLICAIENYIDRPAVVHENISGVVEDHIVGIGLAAQAVSDARDLLANTPSRVVHTLDPVGHQLTKRQFQS